MIQVNYNKIYEAHSSVLDTVRDEAFIPEECYYLLKWLEENLLCKKHEDGLIVSKRSGRHFPGLLHKILEFEDKLFCR